MFIYIYKLIKKGAVNDDMVYIGSTNNFSKRQHTHKVNTNNECDKLRYNSKVYKYIRENGGFDEWEMLVIDEIEVPLKKCEERSRCEQDYIKKYDAINKLNTFKAFRTEEDILNKDKIFRLNNLEKCREKDKRTGKIRYERDKERMIEQAKLNYEKNIEKIKERKKQKISCDICGSIITRGNKAVHQRTQKCINFKNLAI
jgi:hypothetical protein